MRKHLFPIFMTLALAFTASLCALAQDPPVQFDADGIKYEVMDETAKTVQVVTNNYEAETYTIPEKVTNNAKEYTVVKIGNSAFDTGFNFSITRIVLPNTVTSIGNSSFANLFALTTVQLSSGLVTIGDCAFMNCAVLEGELVIPENVEHIGVSAFESAWFHKITLNTKLKTIPELCFRNLINLKTVVIPQNSLLESIEKNAFAECLELVNIENIDNFAKLKYIGESAFSKCGKLTGRVAFNENISTIPSNVFEQTGISELEIHSRITTIGDAAFGSCSKLTTVECHVNDPATITMGSSVFTQSNIQANGTLKVLTPSKYKQAEPWKYFKTIEGLTVPIVNTKPNFGSIRVVNTYLPTTVYTNEVQAGTSVTITVNPDAEKYHIEWLKVNGAEQTIPYTLTVEGSLTVEALLSVITYTTTYTAGAGGSIGGQPSAAHTVEHGDNAPTVTATPAEGYHFVQWSDGSTANPRTDNSVTTNINVTAEFSINQYTITFAQPEHGTLGVSMGGIPVTTGNQLPHGTELTVTANPEVGYHLAVFKINDEAKDAGSIIALQSDVTLEAEFAINTYSLTYTAGANGTLTGEANQTVNHGANGTAVEAIPATGYHFVKWSDGVTANPRTDANVTADITVEAEFAINTYSLAYTAGANGILTGEANQTVNHGANGTAVEAVPATGYHFVKWSDGITANPRTDANVTADITVEAEFAINTYTLTYTAGANGTLTGEANQTVNHGANGTAVEAVPAAGYHFVKWSDGITANPRTDANVTADITVEAEFAVNTYSLTYTAGTNGTLTGEANQTVNHGANGTAVEAVPAAGYHFVQWSDGVTANPRTDANVTADISVEAEFAINTYTLTFSVRAKDNQPVASATIAINGGEISTNLEGTATISLANGDYAYTVTVDGFQSVTGTATINGEDTNVDIVMIPVGVNDTPIASISVYPNPFRDNLVIGNAASVNRIIITNLIGQQVINISNNGNQEVNISTSTLNPGIYLVTTYTANGKRTVKKVVKE